MKELPALDWFSEENLAEIAKWRSRDLDWLKIKTLARHKRVSPGDLEQAIVFFSQPVERPEVVIEPLEAYLARMEPTQYIWDRLLPAGSLAILSADPKCGKAQPLHTPVLTPDGWVPMGELRVGSAVIGRDGLPTEVIAVHPQGVIPAYRVTLDDGTSTVASGEHLWTVHTHDGTRSIRTVTTTELRRKIETNKRFAYLPMPGAVQFTHREIVLDPYVVGVLLGDGGLGTGTPRLTSADEEVVRRVQEGVPAGVTLKPSGKYSYYLSTPAGQPNPLTQGLRQLGMMGKRAWEKSIPLAYLRADVSTRQALLAGLLDTDGGMEGNAVRMTTVSIALARDVQELVWSLGGCARVTTKQPKGGRLAYRVTLRVPYGNPFRLSRKRAAYEVHAVSKRPPGRRVIAIEPCGTEEMQCITVGNTDGLYVTENYILTHNSVTARNLIYRVSRGETFFGRKTMSRGTPVLYLALEEKAEELRDHFRRLGATNEPIWLYVGPIPLEEALSTLAGEIEKRKARLAVVDPLFDMLSLADTNDYALANRAMKAVLAIGRQTGCHILALHHNSKHGEQGSARSILGSAALRGATDANLTMRKGNNDVRYFATEVRYGEDIVEHEVLYDKRTGEVSLGRSTQSLTEDSLRGELLRRLQNRAQSASELRDGVKKNKGLVGKVLREMSEEGVLKVIKNGRNVLYAVNKGGEEGRRNPPDLEG